MQYWKICTWHIITEFAPKILRAGGNYYSFHSACSISFCSKGHNYWNLSTGCTKFGEISAWLTGTSDFLVQCIKLTLSALVEYQFDIDASVGYIDMIIDSQTPRGAVIAFHSMSAWIWCSEVKGITIELPSVHHELFNNFKPHSTPINNITYLNGYDTKTVKKATGYTYCKNLILCQNMQLAIIYMQIKQKR